MALHHQEDSVPVGIVLVDFEDVVIDFLWSVVALHVIPGVRIDVGVVSLSYLLHSCHRSLRIFSRIGLGGCRPVHFEERRAAQRAGVAACVAVLVPVPEALVMVYVVAGSFDDLCGFFARIVHLADGARAFEIVFSAGALRKNLEIIEVRGERR